MRKSIFTLSSILLLFFIGCTSTKVADSSKNEVPATFENVKRSESTKHLSSEISYPSFKDSRLEKMNTTMKFFIDNDFKEFKLTTEREFAEYNLPNPFYYGVTYKVFKDKNIVSVIFNMGTYTGGAHGNTGLKSFNFDTTSQKFINISEATGLSLKELTSSTRRILKSRGYEETMYEGTEPILQNFNSFTVSNGTVTIYFEPYQVSSYAEGVVKVDLPRK